MTNDERTFLELVSIFKIGVKKGKFDKQAVRVLRGKQSPKLSSVIIIRLDNDDDFDKIEIRFGVGWKGEASGMLSGSGNAARLRTGSVHSIIGSVIDNLPESIQEEIVYNLHKI
jgi:hypothetical protein